MNKRYLIIALFSAAVSLGLSAAKADETKPQTEVLQRIELPNTHYQMGMGITVFAPNATKARQKQTGPEVCYVLEGEIVWMVEGQAPRTIKAGESYQNLPNVAHLSKAGPKGAKILATWVLEQGKPFVIPVP